MNGQDVPHDVYVVVEIPAYGPGLKLELDKAPGALRAVNTSSLNWILSWPVELVTTASSFAVLASPGSSPRPASNPSGGPTLKRRTPRQKQKIHSSNLIKTA